MSRRRGPASTTLISYRRCFEMQLEQDCRRLGGTHSKANDALADSAGSSRSGPHHRALLSQREAFLIVSRSLIRSINCERPRDPSFGIFVVFDTSLMNLLTKMDETSNGHRHTRVIRFFYTVDRTCQKSSRSSLASEISGSGVGSLSPAGMLEARSVRFNLGLLIESRCCVMVLAAPRCLNGGVAVLSDRVLASIGNRGMGCRCNSSRSLGGPRIVWLDPRCGTVLRAQPPNLQWLTRTILRRVADDL
jgi:hypothetical protein